MIEIPNSIYNNFTAKPIRERWNEFGVDSSAWKDWLSDLSHHISDHNPALRALTNWNMEKVQAENATPVFIATYKDLIDVVGFDTKYGSKIYSYTPEKSARIVDLLASEKIFPLGKATTTEFGVGTNFLDCKNPYFPALGPGGSSNGSAAAVAAGFCDVSIGTDAAGSVRRPAACCGVVSLILSHKANLAEGVFPVAKSLESIGFITRTLDDLIFIWETANLTSVFNCKPRRYQSKCKLGVLRGLNNCNIHPEVRDCFKNYCASLESGGVDFYYLNNDWLDQRTHIWKLLSKQLFDYHTSIQTLSIKSASSGLRDTILVGSEISESKYQNLMDLKAQMEHDIEKAFVEYNLDGILLPIDPNLPLTVAQAEHDSTISGGANNSDYDPLSFTCIANMAGIPVVAYPIKLSHSGLPISVQIFGQKNAETQLIDTAISLESRSY